MAFGLVTKLKIALGGQGRRSESMLPDGPGMGSRRSEAAKKAWASRRGAGGLGKGNFIDWSKRSLPPKIKVVGSSTARATGSLLPPPGKGQFIDWTKRALPPKIRRIK